MRHRIAFSRRAEMPRISIRRGSGGELVNGYHVTLIIARATCNLVPLPANGTGLFPGSASLRRPSPGEAGAFCRPASRREISRLKRARGDPGSRGQVLIQPRETGWKIPVQRE